MQSLQVKSQVVWIKTILFEVHLGDEIQNCVGENVLRTKTKFNPYNPFSVVFILNPSGLNSTRNRLSSWLKACISTIFHTYIFFMWIFSTLRPQKIR